MIPAALRALAARALVSVALLTVAAACSRDSASATNDADSGAAAVVRLTGSDTMVNLDQAWAENYRSVMPDVSVQVAGGGSGVGIAGLIDGILDIAASSRKIEPEELAKATQSAGAEPREIVVGLDALAVFVHKDNPLQEIAIEDLAQIYGEGGQFTQWSQLGVTTPGCPANQIIRISRQSNSGTYVYFRESIVGRHADLKLGSIDQSGSKDVAALVARTPCAIGYSGMAYLNPGVRALRIAKKRGEPGVEPTIATASDGSYPIARPLYFYTHGTPSAETRAFIDWTLSDAGQKILLDIGYVPAPKSGD
jgi:phosphate transport system substrate-binding protein